ncbi:hypothetical protein [Brevibacillus migulae]|uniref:hypothetical protein n=1 Tax=Brevibacillus migulae TaxID=1644114 RepID=UPI00106E76BB|nr:hypothetical protein [Brevibacillus migulae]
MKKKDVKKLLKENPEFESWLKKDDSRISAIKANPSSARELYQRWNTSKKTFDFRTITEKTARARDMLGNVQSIMELVNEYAKKEGRS